MCYMPITNINSHINCPGCKKRYALCPCCGELMELDLPPIYPVNPMPVFPPTYPAYPHEPWRDRGNPYYPIPPFTPMCGG